MKSQVHDKKDFLDELSSSLPAEKAEKAKQDAENEILLMKLKTL